MKDILYKKWIDPVYVKDEESGRSVKQPNTGCFEEDFTHEGKFLHWGSAYEEFETGAGNYTMGIVMKSDGTIVEVLPTLIKFVTQSAEPSEEVTRAKAFLESGRAHLRMCKEAGVSTVCCPVEVIDLVLGRMDEAIKELNLTLNKSDSNGK